MIVFQLILVVVVVVVVLLVMRPMSGDRSLALKRLTAIVFAVGALLAIFFPGALTWVANILGIGRGADLLLYTFIVAGLLFAVSSVRARARQDARVTELARAVALMEARREESQ